VNTSLLILWLLAVGPGQVADSPPIETKAEADKASAAARERATTYVIRLAESPDKQVNADNPLKMAPEPVFRWTNHLGRRFYGDIYVWTLDGRPEVVASITTIFTDRVSTYTEIQSVSTGRPVLSRDEKIVWEPSAPGVDFQPLPGAPKAAAAAPARLTQMRALAAQFSLVADYEKEQTENLRLLASPIYRYQSAAQGVADGALFAFTKGTDPDAFLLIEARGDQDAPQYHFAFARFNGSCALRALHKDTAVWHVDRLASKTISDPRQPYFNFR
jgi:hypothetical protein